MGPTATLTEQELKLTAALYAARPGVVERLRMSGQLPDTVSTGGASIAMPELIERRGRDITLTADEQVVHDAILREGRLPGGSVRLVERDQGPE